MAGGRGEVKDDDAPLPEEPCPKSLHAAAELGHELQVRRLLCERAHVNETSVAGATPLRAAARRGHLAVAKELLRANASVDVAAFEWHTKAIASRAKAKALNSRLLSQRRPLPATQDTSQPQTFEAINIAPFVYPQRFGDEARAQAARAWDETFRRIGFALIEGHGVSDGLVSELRASARTFFKQSSSYKLGFFKGPQMAGKPGFSPIGVAQEHNDPVEGYTFIRHRTERWSAEEPHPPELGPVGQKYAYEMERVMHALHKMSATALGLEASYFDEYYSQPASVLVLSHYPPLEAGVKLRYRAHSDYSGFTVLLQDDDDCVDGGVGGLEIDINGSWVPVKPKPGCFVVNIGDLFETWTNDRWRSTPHRVRSPLQGSRQAARSRFTAMLFSGPNLDSIISPIRTCVDEDHPSRYAPITAADHLRVQYQTKSKERDYRDAA